MTAESLLSEWMRLSGEESRAIEAGSWDQVLSVQGQKAELRGRLEAMGDAGVGLSEAGRSLVAALVAQEELNLQRVQRRREAAEPQHAELERSRRDLRRIRGSFVVAPVSSWQQYS